MSKTNKIFKPLTRNKIIESKYKIKESSSSQSSFNSSLNLLEISGKLLFQFLYSKLLFPYESEEKEISGNKFQIKLNLTSENYLSLYLYNKNNKILKLKYEILIKNQRNYEGSFKWSDPEDILIFYSLGSGDNYWGTEELIKINELEDYIYDDKLIIEINIITYINDELSLLTSNINNNILNNNNNEREEINLINNNNSLETATNELNILSEKMSQKVRLLSEDAILQDKLISVRLEQQFLKSQQLQMHLQNDMKEGDNNYYNSDDDNETKNNQSVVSTSHHVSIHHNGSVKSLGSSNSKHHK